MRDIDPSDPLSRFDRAATARGQAERILDIQNRVLRLIATSHPFEEVLEALVRAVEARCTEATASILLMDDDGEHLRHGAAPGLPDAYNLAVDGIGIGPAVGSCGTAAYRGEAVVVEDIASDPLWTDFRELAAEHGLAACWSQPIFSAERKILGTFALYYREPRPPADEEREYLRVMTDLAAIAIERHRAELRRRVTERRLLRQKTVLVELAKSDLLAPSSFRAYCEQATRAAAETLHVERVSVWLFDDTRTVLRCQDLYELSLDRHSFGTELQSRNYPRYFAALERGRSVVAHDAHRDADTSEFSEAYLGPLGITSMLDAPIRRGGRLVGVVCHEHVGPRRMWAADEQDFGASIGDFVSLALEARERRRAEQSFRSAQEELLRQDFQARKQIEFELARIKDDLVRQTRLATIGQLSAGIADELRNPLRAIREATIQLRRQVAPAGGGTLDSVEQELQHAEAAINDLLEMSRAQEPGKEVVALGQIVRDAFNYLEAGGDVRLSLVLNPDPFMVGADPGQLRQLMVNLMSNAVEAMQRRGRITVEARKENGFDVVTVSDDGPGMDAALRARAFEPLVTTKAKSHGLGLPICRRIAERHGGTLEAVASGGNGAVFRLRLPAALPRVD